MIETFAREESDCYWAARKKAEERELERLENRLFWMRIAAIGLAALLYIVRVTPV